MPEGFRPNAHHRALAIQFGIDLEESFATFVDHHATKGNNFKSWDRALSTLLLRQRQFGRLRPRDCQFVCKAPEYPPCPIGFCDGRVFVTVAAGLWIREPVASWTANVGGAEPLRPKRFEEGLMCEPLITAEEAGKLLGLHPKTVKQLAQGGHIPAMKIGRLWRFRASALDAWLVAQLEFSRRPSPKGEATQ
jgi:excisionase family DNA binding protein